VDRLGITKKTDELKRLIAKHPDYPIVILAGEGANSGDYPWMYCADIGFEIKEILDTELITDYEGEVITDRDRLEEIIEEQFYDEGLDGDELDNAVKAKVAEFDPYWVNVIVIYADNI